MYETFSLLEFMIGEGKYPFLLFDAKSFLVCIKILLLDLKINEFERRDF